MAGSSINKISVSLLHPLFVHNLWTTLIILAEDAIPLPMFSPVTVMRIDLLACAGVSGGCGSHLKMEFPNVPKSRILTIQGS